MADFTAANDNPSPVLVHLALVLAQICMASLAIVGKLVFPYLPPHAVVLFRVSGAAVLVYAGYRLFMAERVRSGGDLLRLAGLAVLGISANQTLFLTGLEHTTAINATILVTTIPVFTVLLSLLLGREKPSALKVAGIAVSGLGALYLIGPERFSLAPGTALGNALILAGMLAYSLYLVLSKPLLARYRSLTVTAHVLVLGVPGVLPLGFLGLHRADLGAVPPLAWGGVGYIIVIPTIVAYFLTIWALKRASSQLVAGYIYLQPLFVGAIAPLVLSGEHLTGRTLAGGIAVFAGLALVIWGEAREGRGPAPPSPIGPPERPQ